MRKLLEPTISNIAVNHQRNGVSGDPFTEIRFTYTCPEEGYYEGKLIAVIPSQLGDEVMCYVVNAKKAGPCYRGDVFYPAMRKIEQAYNILRKKPLPPGNYTGALVFKDMNEVSKIIEEGEA